MSTPCIFPAITVLSYLHFLSSFGHGNFSRCDLLAVLCPDRFGQFGRRGSSFHGLTTFRRILSLMTCCSYFALTASASLDNGDSSWTVDWFFSWIQSFKVWESVSLPSSSLPDSYTDAYISCPSTFRCRCCIALFSLPSPPLAHPVLVASFVES